MLNQHTLGLPTPWEKLTDLMAYGLRQSDVYVIGANQWSRKTSMALQFAIENVKQNHGVLLFSMEMNHRQVFQRMVGIEAHVDLERFMWLRRQGTIYSPVVKEELSGMVERINEHTNALYNSPLFVNTKTGVTPDYLLKECQRLKSQNPIELVIVDHMQLMASTGTVRGDYEKFTAISRATKEVAMQLNAPVILISQTSRSNAHDKRNELDVSDLRGSGAIEEDASVVLLLYHDAEDRAAAIQQDRAVSSRRFSKGPLKTWLKIGKPLGRIGRVRRAFARQSTYEIRSTGGSMSLTAQRPDRARNPQLSPEYCEVRMREWNMPEGANDSQHETGSIEDPPEEMELCSDCPPVGYPTDKTRCDDCPRRTVPCARCGGSGVIQGRPTTFETDSREEMALAWDMARYPCPECKR
ncbi:MAG: DnaB-like helicase C-terminal domain-containing protein [Betaproteobacteria bacterium]|nr:DnaB-like helicase C-terminal domain-containing protein [Betaproteobacteria bacterium]